MDQQHQYVQDLLLESHTLPTKSSQLRLKDADNQPLSHVIFFVVNQKQSNKTRIFLTFYGQKWQIVVILRGIVIIGRTGFGENYIFIQGFELKPLFKKADLVMPCVVEPF